MKKILLLFGFITIFLIGISSVSAIGEGDIINQTQLDNFQIENMGLNELVMTLQCQMEVNGSKVWFGQWYYYKQFSCLSINPLENRDGLYIIFRDNYYPHFKMKFFNRCVERFDRNSCIIYFDNRMRREARNDIFKIKNKIISFKSDYSDGDDTGFGGSLFN